MNWLAHVFLSEYDIHFRLGNLIADLVKGRSWAGMNDMTGQGMVRHREIDAFTDGHEIVRRSQRRLGERGRLRPVVVDMAYDHMLTRHWSRFCETSLSGFLGNFHQQAVEASVGYPAEVREFVLALVADNRLASYGSTEGVAEALALIDRRLSERLLKRESTLEYLPELIAADEGLESDFLEFFPELMARFGPSPSSRS